MKVLMFLLVVLQDSPLMWGFLFLLCGKLSANELFKEVAVVN